MKQRLSAMGLILILAVAAACGSTPAATPTAPEAAPEVESTLAVEPTDAPAPVPSDESTAALDSIIWQWVELIETAPAGQQVVPDPESYTLVFAPDGQVHVTADCNMVGGTYTIEGDALSIELGPATMAACGEDSLDQEYLALLNSAGSYVVDGSRLTLHLEKDAGQMVFDNGGLVDVAPASAAEGEIAIDDAGPEDLGEAGIDPATVSLDMMGLPYSWQANLVPATVYDDSQPPGPEGLPEHIQVNFSTGAQDQPTPENKQPGDPVMYLIPVDAYWDLWDAAQDPTIDIILEELVGLLSEEPEPIPTAGMPVLPLEEIGGVNDLAVQGEYLDLGGHGGLRFVGRFAQDPNPVTNDGLAYVFQGFSTDGYHLITFFFPVTTDALPGIEGVSAEEQERVASDLGVYLDEKAEMLNALDESDWSPDLSILDSVLASLTYQATAPSGEITGILWQWNEVNGPEGQTLVPDPENYTLVFQPDGLFLFQADCNTGSGIYFTGDLSMALEPGPATQADCGPESLHDQYLEMLGNVEGYVQVYDQLVLSMKGDGGILVFDNGGPAPSP